MGNLLLKIQGLPESKRKLIFWTVIIILFLSLLGFYVKNAQNRLRTIKTEGFKEELKEEFQLPYLEEEFKKLPKIEIPQIEIPEIDQEKLQELERTLKGTPPEDIYRPPTE